MGRGKDEGFCIKTTDDREEREKGRMEVVVVRRLQLSNSP
jgi:hypothetical protein